MRKTKEIFIYLIPCAAIGGVALSAAMATGNTFAWCITTACGVLSLCMAMAAWRTVHVQNLDGQKMGGEYLEFWPRELDVLLSGQDQKWRALSAASLALMTQIPNWPYRGDAVRVLEHVVETENSDKVLASSIGALVSFQPTRCPASVITIAFDTQRPSYVRLAAMRLLAKTQEHRRLLLDAASAQNTEDAWWNAVSALKSELKVAPTEEISDVKQTLAKIIEDKQIPESMRNGFRAFLSLTAA